MSAKIIDGKKISADIKEELKVEIHGLKSKGIVPGLAVVIVGHDPASQIYVRNKRKMAEELGMHSAVFELQEDTDEATLLKLIDQLNFDKDIHGILVQLPLPKHIDEEKVILNIDPKKDVDCFHPVNVGKLLIGGAELLPCTPAGIIELIKRSGIEIEGKECVVIGRSNIVGKPIAILLMENHGTVTICHSKTKELPSCLRRADILIAAVGKAGVVTADMVKPGATVVDVGINRLENGKVAGDVDFENVKEVAGAITPVPGGVGPMTIAMLMRNTLMAAKSSIN